MNDYSYFKVGEKFGTLIIVQKPIIHGKRQMLLTECKCGKQIWIRPRDWKKYKSCKQCVGSTHYPETRRSAAIHYNGLRTIFLKKLYRLRNLNRGEKKKLTVELTIQQLYGKLVEQNFKCALSGVDLNVLHIGPTASNASIDRIDSTKNYTIDNIQWVHKDVNKMKNDFSQKRFIEVCKLVTKNRYDNFEPN
jgi:hypothetical protein